MVREWASKINLTLKATSGRPSKVLVVINPFGGAKKAMQTWEEVAFPVFLRAGKPSLAACLFNLGWAFPRNLQTYGKIAFFASQESCKIVSCSSCFLPFPGFLQFCWSFPNASLLKLRSWELFPSAIFGH